MRGFDTEANLRWHRRAGFDAVFVTDHNTVERPPAARRAAGALSRDRGERLEGARGPAGRHGVAVDRRRYNGSLDALLALLRGSDSAYGALCVLSLPEYDENHWGRLDTLRGGGR